MGHALEAPLPLLRATASSSQSDDVIKVRDVVWCPKNASACCNWVRGQELPECCPHLQQCAGVHLHGALQVTEVQAAEQEQVQNQAVTSATTPAAPTPSEPVVRH
jgi:hypothetical protein